MALLGDRGLVSIGMLGGIADTRTDFRVRVTQLIGPDAANEAGDTGEVARLVCTLESAKIRNEVGIRSQAEGASKFLPVRVDMLEVDTARKTMLQIEKGVVDDLFDDWPRAGALPAEGQPVDIGFEAEHLTRVTTRALDERHAVDRKDVASSSGTVNCDPTSGAVKVTQRGYSIA